MHQPNRLATLCHVAALLCAALPCITAAAVDASRLARAEAVIHAEMQAQRIPGLAIGIVEHGRVLLARGVDDADIIMNRAAGYRLRNGRIANQEWMAPENNRTAEGSLYLSMSDMIAWDRGLRAGRILSAASWRIVYTPVRLNSGKTYPYGFGWDVETAGGQTRLAHDGGTQGSETHISRYLGDDLSIIVLTNLAEGDPARIARHVAAVLSDRLPLPAYAPVTDRTPERRAALQRLLRLGRAGKLTAADLPHGGSGFGADIAASYRSTLEGLSDLRSLVLVSREPLGDDEQSAYLADFAHGRRVVTYTVDSAGGTVAFEIGEPD